MTQTILQNIYKKGKQNLRKEDEKSNFTNNNETPESKHHRPGPVPFLNLNLKW
jgi:hypothetical protein